MAHMTATRMIEHTAATELPAATAVLARAFHDDPVATWVTPDPARRPSILQAFFSAVLDVYARHDEVYVDRDRWGAALWSPPGVKLVDADEEERFAGRLYEAGGRDADRIFQAMAIAEEGQPDAPCFVLGFLGVVPERQGRGLGSALMAPVLRRCDTEGVPAYLEASTSGSRRLYERHGFTTTGEMVIPTGPTLWRMWREPAQRSS